MSSAPLPLASRYRAVTALNPAGELLRWIALDGDTGNHVQVSIVDHQWAKRLKRVVGVSHAHLAVVVDVVDQPPLSCIPVESNPERRDLPPGWAAVVSEYVPGATLQKLLRSGPLNPAKSVAWTLRVLRAVRSVHERRGVLGAISPRSIIAMPETRAIAPVLCQALVPSLGEFCSPERLRGRSPSAKDDVWALHVLLYVVLTGSVPFSGTNRGTLLQAVEVGEPRRLSEFGTNEPILEEILARGLARETHRRVTDIDDLFNTLDAWERMEPELPAPSERAPVLAPKSLIGIAAGESPNSSRMGQVVFDAASLPDDEAPQRMRSAPPRVAPVAPAPPSTASPAAIPAPALVPTDLVNTLPEAKPLGANAMPAQSSRISVNPFETASKKWLWLLVLMAAAGVVVYLSYDWLPFGDSSAPAAVEPVIASAKVAESAPSVVKPSAPKPRRSPRQDTDACVMSFFNEGRFEPGQSFKFLCEGDDFSAASNQLYELSEAIADKQYEADLLAYETKRLKAVEARRKAKAARQQGENVSIPPAPKNPAETRVRRPLGWYELLSAAVIRRSCCKSASPLSLPEIPGSCEQLAGVVREFADASEKEGDLAPRAKRFEQAIACLYASRARTPYKYKGPLFPSHQAAFQRFLAHAAMSEARRRGLKLR